MIRSFTRQAAVIIRKAGSSYYSGSVLIAYQGRVLLHQGYGWADPQKTHPITPHTRFWIASISKQFTAAAIFRLVEQGRLLLKDPLNHFFPTAAADKKAITLQQLLTHTAGLRQNYAADGLTERQAAIDAILAGPLKSPPGECFGYSNDAYNLLAAIVEISAGDPFETSLKRLVLDPAGLADTGFWGMEGHNKVAEIHGEVDEIVRQPNWGFRGAVGMFSTTGDLFRWHLALQRDQVLTSASRAKLLGPQITLDDMEQAGYGWFFTCTPHSTTAVWTRGTEDFGHNAILLTYPMEQVVIAAASNAGNYTGIAITRYLAEQLGDALVNGKSSHTRSIHDK
jgi:CubicO group peptidase (beta-lactamase class C family)